MAKRAIIGRVTTTKRLRSSVNGNPRFEVTIHTPGTGERTFRTQVDSGLAYGIENPEYRNSEHVYVIDGRDQIERAYALNDAHVSQRLLYALGLDSETAKVIADARRAAQIYEES